MAGRMQGGWTEDRAAVELRELVAQLERSGLAERRADVRQLLERSRSLLQARQRPVPAAPQPRAVPSARQVARKLRILLSLGLDTLALAAFLGGGWSALMHRGPIPEAGLGLEVALVLAGPAWILLRLPAAREALREAACRLGYHLAWGVDWFAEAFSRRAMKRLSARLAARQVMWAWQRHRLSLLYCPGPRDVEGFLELAYGAQAADSFRRAAGQFQAGWSLRGGHPARSRAAERLEALRWSVLIRLFEGLAASGALWPEPEAEAAAVEAARTPPEVEPEAEPPPAEPPEVAQRRVDIRELLRKKRQDITAAYGWKLKTEAEIAQRDTYLGQTRREIAELERELAALGG